MYKKHIFCFTENCKCLFSCSSEFCLVVRRYLVRSVSGVYIAIWTVFCDVIGCSWSYHHHQHHLLLPASISWDTCWPVPVSHVKSPFNGFPWRISLLILIMYAKSNLQLNVMMLALILLTQRQKINFDVLLTLLLSIILAIDQHVEEYNKLIIKQEFMH